MGPRFQARVAGPLHRPPISYGISPPLFPLELLPLSHRIFFVSFSVLPESLGACHLASSPVVSFFPLSLSPKPFGAARANLRGKRVAPARARVRESDKGVEAERGG